MNIEQIIAELKAQRDLLNQAIEVSRGSRFFRFQHHEREQRKD